MYTHVHVHVHVHVYVSVSVCDLLTSLSPHAFQAVMISHLTVRWLCATPRGGLALGALSSSIRVNSNPSATQTLMRRSVKWPADSSATQGWRISTWLQGELCNTMLHTGISLRTSHNIISYMY